MYNNLTVNASETLASVHRVRAWLDTNASGAENWIWGQSFLECSQNLDSGKENYTFNLKDTSSPDSPLEIKLSANDAFFLFGIGVGIKKYNPSNAASGHHGNYPLLTAPDPNYFLANDTVNLEEFEALEAIYNGDLTFSTGQVERISRLRARVFRFIGEQSVVKFAAPQINDERPSYGGSLPNMGLFMYHPNLIILGNQDNKFVLNLAQGDRAQIAGLVSSANVAVSTRNKVVLSLYGCIVKNLAEANVRGFQAKNPSF